ncbi:MAG: hypothetical protein ACRCUC_07155 [Aestuariivirga sp.]
MTNLTLTAYAAHRGVAKSRISALRKAGRLVLTPEGLVDVEASDARVRATSTDPDRSSGAVVPPPTAAAAPDDIAGQQQQQPPSTDTFRAARDKKMEYEAEGARLDLLERQRALCLAEDVAAAALTAGTVIRSRIEALPHELSQQLAAETDPAKVFRILDDWKTAAQHDIVDAFKRVEKAGQGDEGNPT